MKTPGVDMISRRLLALLADGGALDIEALARQVGASPEVVAHRLQALRDNGVLMGMSARVDPSKLGRPLEVFALASSTTRTTSQHLEALAADPSVTRVFTLASRNSVAFTVGGEDAESIRIRIDQLAAAAGLADVEHSLIVRTWLDDAAHGLLGDSVPQT